MKMTTDTVKILNECILGYQKQVDILQLKINALKAYVENICEHDYKLTGVYYCEDSHDPEYYYTCSICESPFKSLNLLG